MFEQEYQQKRESFHEKGNQLLVEITRIRDKAVRVLSQLQQAEGKNSLAIFETSKRLQALEESKINESLPVNAQRVSTTHKSSLNGQTKHD